MYTDNKMETISPSQWLNLPFFILGIALIQTGLFPILALIKYIEILCWKYEFNERTIVERKGILSVTRREIHYYRIKSIKIDEPFWMRLVGISNVSITTSDPYHPELVLKAVPNGQLYRSKLRGLTDLRRKEEGVKEFDMYNL
jgi:uncharacterized membrane protein YdbT with pleckstrin-like domain